MPSSLLDPDLLARFGDAVARVHIGAEPGLDPGVRTAIRENLRGARSLGPLREAALTAAPDRRRRRIEVTCAGIVASGAEALGLGVGDPRVRRLFRLLASVEEEDRG